jgi:hypothetical protein
MKLPRIISAMVKLLTTIKYVLIKDSLDGLSKEKESFWRPIDPQESKARQHVFQLLWECQYFHKMFKLQKAKSHWFNSFDFIPMDHVQLFDALEQGRATFLTRGPHLIFFGLRWATLF